MSRRIRVLVVDDSAFARKVVREVVSASPDVEVVGFARDGIDALEKVAELAPDVVTLDLVMPELDGIGVLQALRQMKSPARVVVVSTLERASDLGVAALQAGAFDIVHKPTSVATDRLYELAAELRDKILLAGRVEAPAAEPVVTKPIAPRARTRLVAVGASTGGPAAVTLLLRALRADFAAPLAVVIHMPPGFTELLAKRLDRESELEVVEARDGVAFVPGRVVIAQAGMHLRVEAKGDGLVGRLALAPIDSLHRPSVDVLFESAARAAPAATLGVVLTGMGSDGLAGARALVAAGSRVFTEAEASCVVYGMPRAVHEAGFSAAEARIEDMAELIVRSLG